MERHTAVYARVSSKKQDQASQLPDLKRWAESAEGPVRWYSDKFTGKTMDRPGWRSLEDAMRVGEVERVVVWRLDRLGRTASGLTWLFEDLNRRGIGLISIKDGVDLSTAAGRLMANVLASVAVYDNEVRTERIVAGLAVAKERGTRSGRAIGRPAGSGKPLKVTPDQADLVRRLKGEGSTVAKIARVTGLSRPTVYRLLTV